MRCREGSLQRQYQQVVGNQARVCAGAIKWASSGQWRGRPAMGQVPR